MKTWQKFGCELYVATISHRHKTIIKRNHYTNQQDKCLGAHSTYSTLNLGSGRVVMRRYGTDEAMTWTIRVRSKIAKSKLSYTLKGKGNGIFPVNLKNCKAGTLSGKSWAAGLMPVETEWGTYL